MNRPISDYSSGTEIGRGPEDANTELRSARDRGFETLGDQLHRIIESTHPYLAVCRRTRRFEHVDEVVREFVSERPNRRRRPETDLTV